MGLVDYLSSQVLPKFNEEFIGVFKEGNSSSS
jgi:hypothetical protein